MSENEPTSRRETHPTQLKSLIASEPKAVEGVRSTVSAPLLPPRSSPDARSPAIMAEPAARPLIRRSLSKMRVGVIVAAALMASLTGLLVGLSTSSSVSAAQSVATSRVPGNLGSGGQGSNARSGPAVGGSSGTVGNAAKSSFTLTTSTGQKVTVDEQSSTKYEKGTRPTSQSTITNGDHVLVLGTVSSTTIKATQIIVETTHGGTGSSTEASVVPFQRGAQETSKQVGQIPASYSEGSGTIVSGTTANKATEAALAVYPGGIVDRVVKLSNGDYEVHNIGLNWPHHVFVNQNFKVIGAD